MKSIWRWVLLASFLMSLSGCATTGGAFGNLIPMPKNYKGTVREDVYQSKNGWFLVKLPFQKGSPAYSYMSAHEEYTDRSAFVWFNSSLCPEQWFQVQYVRFPEAGRPPLTLDEMATKTIDEQRQELQKGAKVADERRSAASIDGKSAVLWECTQSIAAGIANDAFSRHHLTYVVEGRGALAALLLTYDEGNAQQEAMARAFAESFAFLDSVPAAP